MNCIFCGNDKKIITVATKHNVAKICSLCHQGILENGFDLAKEIDGLISARKIKQVYHGHTRLVQT